MTTSTLAFHGDTKLAGAIIAEVGKHEAADAFLQGEYFKKNGAGYKCFRGCFIGCATHSYEIASGSDVSGEYDSVDDVERAFNFDPRLTRICERVFEDASPEYAKGYLRKVSDAALAGAERGVNIRLVHWKFLHWMVKDTLEKRGTPEVRKGCRDAVAVLKDLARGVNVTPARAARAAYAAARAADAADAADAARAADAADAAADAARAADAAAYAAYAARAADAADAADANGYETRMAELGDKLVQFIAGEAS